MSIPEKIDFGLNPSTLEQNESEDYELIPEKEVNELREELRKTKEFEVMPTKRLHVSLNELNSKLDKLIAIFDEASHEIKTEEGGLSFQDKMRPVVEKMNKILEQNSEIAEGIVALADVIKDFREDLETKGILVAEKKIEPQFTEQPAPQPLFQSQPLEMPPMFPQRMPPLTRPISEQATRPFEAPRPPSSPPPIAPPKKKLFGL